MKMKCKKCGSKRLTYRPKTRELPIIIPIRDYYGDNTKFVRRFKTMYCIDCEHVNIYEEKIDVSEPT